jgi:hypothetical protein
MMPTRSQILQSITNGYNINQEIIIKTMDRFSKQLKLNIVILKSFYEENNLESNII